MKIRAYVDYNEWNKKHYYRDFELVNSLPEIGSFEVKNDGEWRETVKEINEVSLDCEQGTDDVYNYKYYEVVISVEYSEEQKVEYDEKDYEYSDYICIDQRRVATYYIFDKMPKEEDLKSSNRFFEETFKCLTLYEDHEEYNPVIIEDNEKYLIYSFDYDDLGGSIGFDADKLFNDQEEYPDKIYVVELKEV